MSTNDEPVPRQPQEGQPPLPRQDDGIRPTASSGEGRFDDRSGEGRLDDRSGEGRLDDRSGEGRFDDRSGEGRLDARSNNQEQRDISNEDTDRTERDAEAGDQAEGHKPQRSHKLENEEAIPTAGGERLGEQHWGESEVVPDNPQPRESVAERGAGGAGNDNSGDGNDNGKEGLIGKVKNILHKS